MALSMVAGYYAEVDVLSIILLVSLAYKAQTSSFISSHRHYFVMVLVSNIVLAASDLVWIFNNGFLSLTEVFPNCGIALSWILNGLNGIFAAALGLTWLLFSEAILGNYLIRNRKKFILVLIPFILIVLLVLTTGYTHLMFSVSEDGVFTRGIGYALEVAVMFGYTFASVIHAFFFAKRAKTLQARQQASSIAHFVVAPVCAGVAQTFLSKMPVLFIGTVVGFLYVYISLQEQQVLTDPLTGLNNRRLLDQKIEAAIQKKSSKTELYLLVIDTDNFKSINDQYGHIEGDKALKIIADSLKESCGKEDFVCRSGGDEFIILHSAAVGDDCTKITSGIEKCLSSQNLPYPLTVSVGKQHYTPDMGGWKKFVDAADEEMYRVKEEKKAGR